MNPNKKSDIKYRIWNLIRSPFRTIHCTCHEWEIFDIQFAGCLKCGECHYCDSKFEDNTCTVMHLEDGSICCPITGFCIPVIRYSDKEYFDNVLKPNSSLNKPHVMLITFEEIFQITQWFLMGKQAQGCIQEETLKAAQKLKNELIKKLKEQKINPLQLNHKTLPCVLSVLSHSIHVTKPRLMQRADLELCKLCAMHILACLKKVELNNNCNKKINVVVGMLYLMKQGLVIKNQQWLPRVEVLKFCLPHENCLEKIFSLSLKVICETENELKVAIRQQIKML